MKYFYHKTIPNTKIVCHNHLEDEQGIRIGNTLYVSPITFDSIKLELTFESIKLDVIEMVDMVTKMPNFMWEYRLQKVNKLTNRAFDQLLEKYTK